MAFSLTKAEQKDMSDKQEALAKAYTDLEDAVSTANDTITDAVGKLNDEVRIYNEALNAVTSFVEDVASRMRGEFDDKSEAWQEGERGQAAEGMIGEWEGFSLDEAADFEFEEFDIDASDGEQLNDLPTNPD